MSQLWSYICILSAILVSAFHREGLLCLSIYFSLSRYNNGFTSSCKTDSNVLIHKIVKMLGYLMPVAVWRLQYYVKEFDIWVRYRSVLKISKRKEDKLHDLHRIVYNWFCKFFSFHSGDILYFSPQNMPLAYFAIYLCCICLPHVLTS